ncbi:MAG: superoxide dismutase [Spirochaetaceae bacterium]|nr:superoxide dismutase [Spirochaetaceae bacterium]
MSYSTPALGFAYDALEPHIDARTMEIHHDKHHVGYTTKLNAAVSGTSFDGKDPAALLADLKALPDSIRGAVQNNGGGHVNHALFWEILTPGGSPEPEGDIKSAIESAFGGIAGFKKLFSDSAATRFGSGWAWLVSSSGKLKVYSTANQDSPLSQGDIPLLSLDVWEHAYYLNYQNRRPDYIAAFWNLVNWDIVASKFKNA